MVFAIAAYAPDNDGLLPWIEKPNAPASIASRITAAMRSISSGVASRCAASSPITQVRTEEWPT